MSAVGRCYVVDNQPVHSWVSEILLIEILLIEVLIVIKFIVIQLAYYCQSKKG
jgi:hypothetical protein